MIQFNLLPDVKKEYIKTKRTKRLIMTVSFFVSIVSILVVGLTFGVVQGTQKSHISNLSDDIEENFNQLKSTEDIDEILTVQNQLASLTQLHESKPETSRLFEYLTQLTPSSVTITTLDVDILNSTMSISGRADTLATVNKFADTLKFTTYKVRDSEGEPIKTFDSVVTRLNRDNEGATYTIDMNYDPIIFDNTSEVALIVPDIVSTRSTINKPGESLPVEQDVFDDTPEPVIEEGEE